MKNRVSIKSIREFYGKIVYAEYCALQDLLRFHQPDEYTAGTYGWNFDVYYLYGVAICTGYRGMPGRRAKNAHEYNGKASAALEAVYSRAGKYITWQEADAAARDKLETLIKEFCEQA